MTEFTQIKFERDGKIASIQLHRPDAANGLNTQMAAELKQAAQICDREADIRVVILRAEGRFFCAGGDIKEMQSHGDEVGAAIKALADDCHEKLEARQAEYNASWPHEAHNSLAPLECKA